MYIPRGPEGNESAHISVLCSNAERAWPSRCVAGVSLQDALRDYRPSVHEGVVRGWPLPLLSSSRKTGQGHLDRLLMELCNLQHFPSGGAFLFP